jgi:hypothetical protein
MCPEWVLDLVYPTDSVDRSRAPDIQSFEYWKMKSQAVVLSQPPET